MSSAFAIPHSPINITTTSRTIDKCLEDAQHTGDIILTGRQLKEYPKNYAKYDLSCTLVIDLSRNKLSELPQQLETLISTEVLNLSHNIIRSIPSTIIKLSNLVSLNLNRNLLTTLPSSLGNLAHLEMLLINNNKLVSIPEEICSLRKLMQLDVSCNQLAHLPPHLGHMTSLQSLNLRQNLLVELPISIGQLNLKFLDFSSNRVTRIPVEFGRMGSLEILLLEKNPLMSPPANVCCRGLVHILTMLNNEEAKNERRRSHLYGNSPCFSKRKFTGSTSCLSFESSASPSLTSLSSSSSFSTKQPNPHLTVATNPASLPPQSSKGNRLMSRSFKSSSKDEMLPVHYLNGDIHKHQRSSSFASGMTHKPLPPFSNGSSHHDGSTLGKKMFNVNSYSPVQNGGDVSDVVAGCQDEINETRKIVTKLMDGTRRRRLSQGVDREEIQQITNRMNPCNNGSYQLPMNGHNSPSSSSSSQIQCSYNNNNNNTLPSVHPKNVLPLACRKALESMTRQLNDLEPGFTLKRSCKVAMEEEDLIARMNKVLESMLGVVLPADSRTSLNDGVLLCLLVNHCFPLTIPFIHTPVHPKAELSVAKCRLNVDNFLVSCHMVGLNKSQICSAPAILNDRNLADVARTVLSLVDLARGQTSV